VVLVGAQAVYLRTAGRLPTYQPFTTDADIVVDHGPVEITAIDPADERSIVINVAGEAAMLVAKLHKLGDRLEKPERLDAKDTGDVYRLFDVIAPDDMATRLERLLDDERSAGATAKAIAYGDVLLGSASDTGVRLGVDALRTTIPEATAVAVLTGYWRALRAGG
jgi:hypothetical protein